MNSVELKIFLDEKAAQYEAISFLEDDPIQIPHQFSKKEDIEISAFLVATIAWGNRKSIIKSGKKMMELVENDPYKFVKEHTKKDLEKLHVFVHRTFNGHDFTYFITALQHIYTHCGGLENVFSTSPNTLNLQDNLHNFNQLFFSLPHQKRTEKHVADPWKGSAAKRINMFLRWMVRPAHRKVDFGLWSQIHPRQLSCPLDVHSGNVARKLNLLQRKQNDAKAVLELDQALRAMDENDPVKYDFALFGLGVFEQF